MRRTIIKAAILGCIGAVNLSAAIAQQLLAENNTAVTTEDRSGATLRQAVITAVAMAPGGQIVATAGDDHLVRLWSTASGRMVQQLKGHADWVRTLRFSPDGKSLASGGDDRQIIVWHASDGKIVLRMPVHDQPVYSIDYGPDGSLLAAVGFERQVTIYDARSGTPHSKLEGPGTDLRSVAFSPDGSQLAAGGRNGKVRVWQMPLATVHHDIQASESRIRAVAWLPDGHKLASAGDGRTISIWDTVERREHYRFQCPAGKVLAMAVCGEDLLATGGSDNSVRVWNWKTQSEVDRLAGHTGSVAAIAFDPVSSTIISAGYDTTIRVWKLNLSTSESAGDATPGAARVGSPLR